MAAEKADAESLAKTVFYITMVSSVLFIAAGMLIVFM